MQKLLCLAVILLSLIITIEAQEDIIGSRGYLTSPEELRIIAVKAENAEEPFASTVEEILRWASREWNLELDRVEDCPGADNPRWLDNESGIPRLYARAIAYQFTDESHYAEEVIQILHQIISTVEGFSLDRPQCQLNLSWGIPEIVASADLVIEELNQEECAGPLSPSLQDMTIGRGNCLELFQNWLAKVPYYTVSLAAENSQNNWGASATNTLAYIADFLSNRPDIVLIHRMPLQLNDAGYIELSPAEAYQLANQLALNRMNGYRVDYRSSDSCDFLSGEQQSGNYLPVKSQITELGIVTEDARREEYCNIPQYNDEYQNYPQLYLGHNIQQCELMLRRGDSSCYDNIALDELPEFTYIDANGDEQTTSLKAGRGSIERAINAVIIDAQADWRHDSALEVAFAYYQNHSRFGEVQAWLEEIDQFNTCFQDICFATLSNSLMDENSGLGPRTNSP